jgi:hypothetical protein
MPGRIVELPACTFNLLFVRIILLMKSQKYYNKILKQIGQHLVQLREKNGYPTLKEFVQKHDLPEIQYWRMEKGKANITLKSLLKILSIHKVSLHEFFCVARAEERFEV